MNDANRPPETLGRYELLAEIGHGTMGVVYKAMDPQLGRLVALKVMRLPTPLRDQEREELEQRFLLEANMAAGLSHPNIVVVHDVGRDPLTKTPFMALEYLEGRTLAETVAQGHALDWHDALRLVALLADALHHAHSRGIVHRDVKPANVMVLPSGAPKILDFGIAKILSAQLTAAGQGWGTPFYMSPEQAAGLALDGRSDLFSLGSVLYELLTGRRAFAGENILKVMARVMHEAPQPPSQLEPSLPADLDTVVMCALAKDPNARYADGRALVDDIEDVLQARGLRSRAGSAAGLPVAARVEGRPRRRRDDLYAPSGTTPLPRRSGTPRRLAFHALGWGAALLLAVAVGIGARALLRPSRATDMAAAVPLASASTTDPVPASTDPPRWLLALTGTSPEPPKSATPASAASAAIPPLEKRVAAAQSKPSAAPSPSAATVLLTVPAPAAGARVALALEHGFKQGRLRVWIDDTLVLEKPLTAVAKTRGLFFTRSQGHLAEILDVAPGQRMFRIEIEGDDDQHRGGQLTGLLRQDETRLLEVKVGSRVQLRWKS